MNELGATILEIKQVLISFGIAWEHFSESKQTLYPVWKSGGEKAPQRQPLKEIYKVFYLIYKKFFFLS